MLDIRPILFVLGLLMLVLATAMAITAAITWSFGDPDFKAFLGCGAAVLAAGAAMVAIFKPTDFSLSTRQMFLLTGLSWLSVSALGALPFAFSDVGMGVTDAFFEATSGITTTGSTVLTDLGNRPHGVLLWRSILQWVGGIGIVVMAVAILPFLRVGGMRLFHTESSDISEKVLARAGQIAVAIGLIYLLISFACALAYWLAGMEPFDAVAHAMTTVSTGGYSTWDLSLGHYSSLVVQWVAVVFMIAGALPFMLYVRALRTRAGLWAVLKSDRQAFTFVGFLCVVWSIFTAWRWITTEGSLVEVFTQAALNITSVVTTTGYVSSDYGDWGPFAVVSFFFLMFIGGCAGSTSGGIKIFRFQIAGGLLRIQLRRLLHPQGRFTLLYNNQAVREDLTRSVMAFSFFFVLTVAFLAMALAMLGLDPITSLSGAATAVTNVGPGLGNVIGPAGNFAILPAAAKWLLCLGMLLGRLEIITLLVLLTPGFWRGW